MLLASQFSKSRVDAFTFIHAPLSIFGVVIVSLDNIQPIAWREKTSTPIVASDRYQI